MTAMNPDMSPPPTATALGPYTAWMYGPGNAYDFFAADRGRAPHVLSGVVGRAGGHVPTSSRTPISAGGVTASLYAPTMWDGLPSPCFVPFMMSGVEARSAEGALLDALWRTAGPADVALPGGGGLGPKAGDETFMNAGFPLREDSVDLAASGASTLSADPAVDPKKPLVVIGIIDDGIPFANRAFDGLGRRTRVDACWVQGAAHDGSGRVRFGREVTGDDITSLRQAHGVDEDAIYRAAGALVDGTSLSGDIAHGAHTLGALAESSDVQVRIIAVDLPPASTWDASGYGRDMLMLAGMHYIFDRADKLAAAYGKTTLPMVVNISYGYSGGAHDGQSTLEAAFDELIEARRAKAPTGLTLPSGNMLLDAMHAVAEVASCAEMDPLPWRVQPSDRTSTFMECWLPEGLSPDTVSFRVHGPGPTYGPPGPEAATAPVADPGGLTTMTPIFWQGKTVGQLSLDQDRSGRWRYLVALAPTESGIDGHAPAGLWKIAVTNNGPAAQVLRFWIQRDISYGHGETGARQSYFDEAANARVTRDGRLSEDDSPDAMTRRAGSLNGMATGATPLIVGAARDRSARAEMYGSASYAGDAREVDLSAMVSATEAEVGRLSLTVRSGSRVRLSGTSVSSPAVGATLRDIIAAQPAGASSDNYAAALMATGLFGPVEQKDAPRLGRGVRT
ncbi:MAG: hypothetical protein MK180_16580 [Rhodobacteraceae bacterium]|nr:hypothetical protein [Paracoccaceae bacterium]